MLVKHDEKVIVQPPVYPPFFNIPKSLQREVVYNPLQHGQGGWHMDLQHFEECLKKDASIRMFILCNPHNPTGQCYTLEEINNVMKLCKRYNVWVVSDEIHADIIMPNPVSYTHLDVYKRQEYANRFGIARAHWAILLFCSW